MGDRLRFHFEPFTLDSSTRLLLKGEDVVRISPKAFQLLLVLVENAPNAVSKQEIQERVWPDTFVTETNLPTLVGEIRSALDDDSREPRFVRTVYGFGYAFSGELKPDDAPARAPQALVAHLLGRRKRGHVRERDALRLEIRARRIPQVR